LPKSAGGPVRHLNIYKNELGLKDHLNNLRRQNYLLRMLSLAPIAYADNPLSLQETINIQLFKSYCLSPQRWLLLHILLQSKSGFLACIKNKALVSLITTANNLVAFANLILTARLIYCK
jgi:hypothetical protein